MRTNATLRRNTISWLIIAFFFAFHIQLHAFADATSASISISVSDPTGALVPNASMVIRSTDTNQEQRASSGKAGSAHFSYLKPGHYKLVVSKSGFADLRVDNILLNVGDEKVLQLVLKIGSADQAVTVDASGQTINTTDGSVSTVINRNFVANMPLNGRSFQDLLTLSPGVSQVPVNLSGGTIGGVGYSGEIVVNGQRSDANYFTVDGVSVNTGVTASQGVGQGSGPTGAVAGETALGTTQSLVSVDALQEFRATTSTYSAEYGRTPGGQFSFVTRSGTEHFHGSAYDYLRNDAMDANNWFNNQLGKSKGKERQNDFGGTFGGPLFIPGIHRSKPGTFFFASYEGLRLDSPQAAVKISVPDSSLRQSTAATIQPLLPVLNAFPVPNAGEDGLNDGVAYYIESVSYPAQIDTTSIRLDHHISDKWNLFARYSYSPSSNTSYSGAVKNSVANGLQTFTIGSTNYFNAHHSNDLRFNITHNVFSSKNVSTNLGGAQPLSLDSIPGLGTNGSLTFYLLYSGYPSLLLGSRHSGQYQYNVVDTYNWAFHNHNVRLGVDWRRLRNDLFFLNPNESVYYYTEAAAIANSASAASNASAYAYPTAQPIYTNFSAFAQDEWKATSRLTLSMGVRWDINPAPHDGLGHQPYTLTQTTNLANTLIAPAGTPLWKTDWTGFAPRLGLAYQVHQTPGRETVFRAGYGLFYDLGAQQGSFGYSGIGISTTVSYPGASYPFTPSQLQLLAPTVTQPYSGTVYAFDPSLRLPYAMQYSAAIEQATGRGKSFTLSYVGSTGNRLLSTFDYYPSTLGNTAFSSSSLTSVTSNRGSSAYNSLQAKFQSTEYKHVQALASYTWSHAIDNSSANALLSTLLRANSSFDIRHQLQAAVTYNIPTVHSSHLLSAIVNDWSLDLRLQARSALPIDIASPVIIVPGTGQSYSFHPNFVPGQAIYLYSSTYPGKRIINRNAFVATSGVEGNVPRNFARGFDAVQNDLAIRRRIKLTDQLGLQFRAEAFNIFNHPEFGSIYNSLSYGPTQFGYAYNTLNGQLGGLNPLYQIGGPRSLQVMLKLEF